MGTPQFAVPSLTRLVEEGFNIVGVITATDKYGGRGRKQLIESPIKLAAQSFNIPVLQPRNLKATEFNDQLRALKPDLQVVVAFRMLPEIVWDLPGLGTFNLHASLLPQYRGAAPINWAIINGERTTGMTTFFIRKEIDTGDILFQETMDIGPDETAGELHDRMMVVGAELVVKTTDAVIAGDYVLDKQDETLVSKAPKIFTDDCKIDWNQPIDQIYNFIRGLSPYPGAWTEMDGKTVKILQCSLIRLYSRPGTILTNQKDQLIITGKKGAIQINRLQMAGKQKMDVSTFLNGYQIDDFRTS